ncbi:MAG: TlyA family RNA methyltransferase [Acidobacteriota bacterium]|nr:TlyA family RNA methyltransferase [Acidobacteriota bacterium]
MKRRVDQLLVERGFAESRHKAQALLLAGRVLVQEQKVEKPGQRVPADAEIRILRQLQFVSRAGAKLQAALDHFQISVAGRVCVDLGASTGGFTDCLLQNGASRVHAFDVGQGQLAWKLQSDPRVVIRDRFNVRNISAADLPANVSFVCIDLSFISVTKVLLPLRDALLGKKDDSDTAGPAAPVDIIVLVKPQFEVGKGEVGKGGIVRDPAKRDRVLEEIKEFSHAAAYRIVGGIPSPIRGAEGNQEFLLCLQLTKGLSSTP